MKPNPKDRLIGKMISVLEKLGRDCFARIDARVWAEYFQKRAKRLKIKL